MGLLQALSALENAVRSMKLVAEEHERLKQAVQVLFNHIKMLEEKAKEAPQITP